MHAQKTRSNMQIFCLQSIALLHLWMDSACTDAYTSIKLLVVESTVSCKTYSSLSASDMHFQFGKKTQ